MTYSDREPRLRRSSFDELPGWHADRMADAFSAVRRSAVHAANTPYKTGATGISMAGLAPAFAAARSSDGLDDDAARGFFEHHFRPWRVEPTAGRGFVTGFYEPQVQASLVRSDAFRVPLLAPPDDLVAVKDDNRPHGFDPDIAFARMGEDGLVAYHDRKAIEQGALGRRAVALAWLADRVDAFFVHVQGAARLVMPDGAIMRVTYAAKSGHPFTGPGGVLADLGEIPREEVTMQSIRAWFADHPDRVDEILWRNRSYIFFREAPVAEPELGPIAAAKVPLTPGRSLAVDRLVHIFASPVFIDAPKLAADGAAAPFRRLMIAQDTGSAIIGAARGDLFMGCGDAAGAIAGRIRHEADFHLLVPAGVVPRGAI